MEPKSIEQDNRILIVDDDKSVRDFLEIFLKRKGYANIQSVETGLAAIDIVSKEDIRLVLLDIKLPDMDGLDVLRRMKKVKKDTGVIMITGHPDQQKARDAIKDGAYDFIVKPFDLKYLELSVLTKILLMQ